MFTRTTAPSAAHDQDYRVGATWTAAQAADPEATAGDVPRATGATAGKVATRNYIALCATVNCSATVIRRAADTVMRVGVLRDYPNVDGVVAFAHGTGCGMAAEGPGWENLQRVLWGHATHPNVGAAIFVGLGCEVMQIARMKQHFGADGSERFHGLTIQDTGGTTATIERIVAQVHELLPEVNRVGREPIPASELKVALQCGGSDGFSGITANPALGVASDLLVGLGGTAVLAETPEIYGAEQLLLRRAASQKVADKLIARIRWWEEYTAMNGGSMDNNPSPRQQAGRADDDPREVARRGGQGRLDAADGRACLRRGRDGAGVRLHGHAGLRSGLGHRADRGRLPDGGVHHRARVGLRVQAGADDQGGDERPALCGDARRHGHQLRRHRLGRRVGAEKGREILEAILRTASGERTKSEALGLGDNEFVPWQVGCVM